jgi:hypothetical protein
MCQRCVELEEKIERYRALARRVTDKATLEGIAMLIEKMEANKAALHPPGG